ncbi:hypothetical protein D9758_000010 [Tetrapyrgos nigripes]|uniref:Beta-galactosidase jelly roll domain-containing protein n=1 Tax=Tetrapyrgos nigripes TaxID=182062 RepID=A0A8H5LZ58_9AGAR|nr:hypothetical protein D9758_000010 [Tetrapyrgos nigripes]
MKSPRSVRGFQLNSGAFVPSFPDEARVLNEGRFFGERKGWHLPGFDTSSWDTVSDLSLNASGVGFFVTTFDLNVPQGQDVMMSFNFIESGEQGYRALLFVNGWMMESVSQIWDLKSSSCVFLTIKGRIAVWSMTDTPVLRLNSQLTVDGVFDGTIQKNNPAWSADGRE